MSDSAEIATTEFSFILKPSTIPQAGIGVFATHVIPQGAQIKISPRSQSRRMQAADIPDVFKSYCIAEEDGWYKCPMQFNHMEIGWFINHSFDSNIERRDGAWYTLKQIHPGDEILLDYNSLNEPEDKKEIYYKTK